MHGYDLHPSNMNASQQKHGAPHTVTGPLACPKQSLKSKQRRKHGCGSGPQVCSGPLEGPSLCVKNNQRMCPQKSLQRSAQDETLDNSMTLNWLDGFAQSLMHCH